MVTQTNVRLLRQSLQMSQTVLAGKLGISRRHLIRIETGDRPASDELAKKIAKALDASVRQLFSSFAINKRLALPFSPGSGANSGLADESNGRWAWILDMSLTDRSVVRLEISPESEHARILGKLSESASESRDRSPFAHIHADQYLVFINLDHVEVATLSQTLVDIAKDTDDAEDLEAGPVSVPRFRESPREDGWAAMASGYEETPYMLVNEDPSRKLGPMVATRVRDAFIRDSAGWTRGGRITLTDGQRMSTYLVDATMLLYVPLNSEFIPS